jgi:hypothetical protein
VILLSKEKKSLSGKSLNVRVILVVLGWIGYFTLQNYVDKTYKVLTMNESALRQFEDNSGSFTAITNNQMMWVGIERFVVVFLVIMSIWVLWSIIRYLVSKFEDEFNNL